MKQEIKHIFMNSLIKLGRADCGLQDFIFETSRLMLMSRVEEDQKLAIVSLCQSLSFASLQSAGDASDAASPANVLENRESLALDIQTRVISLLNPANPCLPPSLRPHLYHQLFLALGSLASPAENFTSLHPGALSALYSMLEGRLARCTNSAGIFLEKCFDFSSNGEGAVNNLARSHL